MRYRRQIWRALSAPNYRLLFAIGCCILISLPSTARALIVTEIMYDVPGTDTGREWIELYNDTPDAITLSNWKLFESNSNHSISAVRGDGVISPNEYAIVSASGVASISDFTGYTGDVFDSSFSLNNAGESFSFKTPSGSYVADVTYVGGVLATGDGNSLHWIGSQWTARTPNPGGDPSLASNAGQTTNSQTATGQGAGSSGGSGSNIDASSSAIRTTAVTVPQYQMTVTLNPADPVARAPLTVTPRLKRTLKDTTEEYTFGIVRIVTGDGRQIVRDRTEPITFTYGRAGAYRLVVEYSQSSLVSEPLARYSIDVQVHEPTIVIGRNGYVITLTNESDTELDISNYRVVGYNNSIVIAPGTILLPSTTISVGDSATILKHNPSVIELVLPDGTTKVSRREFDTKLVTEPDAVVRTRSVQFARVDSQKEMIAVSTSSLGSSDLFAGARDPSLVVPIPLETTITTMQLQRPSPQPVAPLNTNIKATSHYSVELLLGLTVVAFAVLSGALLYLVRIAGKSIDTENQKNFKQEEVFDNIGSVDDYIIIDRS